MTPERFYWQEVDEALRPMAGVAAVLAAALGAMLTLTGAVPHHSQSMRELPATPEFCARCWLRTQAAEPAAPHRSASFSRTASLTESSPNTL